MKHEIYQKENGFPPVKCLAELHSPVSSDFVTVTINNERYEYYNIDKTTLKEIVVHKILFSKPTKVLEEMLEALEPLKKKLEKEPLPPGCSEKYTDCLTNRTSCGLIDEDGDCFVKKWYRLCDLYALEQKPNNTEKTAEKTVFVVSSRFCGDFFIDAAFSTRQQAEDFITQHEMSSGYITELTIDKPSECTEDIPFSPTPKPDERVNHPKHYQHPSGIECITVARHHDFNIGNALKYLWRAGIKQEQGISPTDKQIEDFQKAVFYIQDEIQFLKSKQQEQ